MWQRSIVPIVAVLVVAIGIPVLSFHIGAGHRTPERATRGTMVVVGLHRSRLAALLGEHDAQPRLPSDPYPPSAIIAIPRLGVRAPIYERGLDRAGQPLVAPGYALTHYTFSAPLGAPGNYVLYGHDDIEGSIFRDLDLLRPGDAIYLYSEGRRVAYRVSDSAVVAPSATYVMNPTTTATLTMISCTPYWVDTQRLIVKAALVASNT